MYTSFWYRTRKAIKRRKHKQHEFENNNRFATNNYQDFQERTNLKRKIKETGNTESTGYIELWE